MLDLRLGALALFGIALLPGCPWHSWLAAHHGHGHEPEEPVVCEVSADCDDGLAETYDECTDDAVCSARLVSYEADIQAIFQAKCAGCHVDSGGGVCAGNVCLASSYAALELDSQVCVGASVAECAQQRVHDGSMPRGRGCTGDPELDAGNVNCLTAEEHALLDAWIAAGWPELTP